VLAGLALLLSACGGGGGDAPKTPPAEEQPAEATPTPLKTTPAAKDDVAVIRGWTDALRKGHLREAARYFSLPAIVSNGTAPLRLTTRRQVMFFNATLPCGGKFKRATDTGAYVVATLVLTERPGAGRCAAGVGEEAYTAFLIRRHKIVQWRRVVAPPAEPSPSGPES
jgi:hypothetical protein